jgi:hypothetical protein
MRVVNQAFRRGVTIGLLLFVCCRNVPALTLAGQQEPTGQPRSTESQSGQIQPAKLQHEQTPPSKTDGSISPKDESSQPASVLALQTAGPAGGNPAGPAAQGTGGQMPPPQPRQDGTRKPSGAAAAETEMTNGVAASRPAGVAIAPAKQRRGRALLVKLGAVLGAGAAVGTVLALSRSSSSRPPGSH